ncbi:uncharacterized protein LOC126874329 isoform X10 [Bombus huntii]|uniref:uncharacterized protein LOC126874329 isoform X10 n=1 Tax=Bombus huntii TaxID=85661 RepID=UPI0021AA1591|nr:uncharacterized protein LOC126874329 isoform X10 [Bombus huntii]XP_050492201.1 uncharacterized protein LOC126874329 isoform X11 [Bombus huntii]XP_050492202.1 uncharacterized protein LOC126874329 isoform X10 [Bombus huntii]XP_050492203.1 uncharacterized protein LOC126874329 isoform X12 [Bombus huntii]XP_050492204.1 uncharacterized protein LOC126874329 isoform X10 [Bombus huntii]
MVNTTTQFYESLALSMKVNVINIAYFTTYIASVLGFVGGVPILYSSSVRIAIHVLPSVVQRMIDEFAISSVHTYKNNSTYLMLRHLPGSFPQRRPILRYALDTYYGCLQSSYICGHKGFRYLCCSTNSAMLPHWLLYMVFRKQGAITYFARKPSCMMITCSQGSCHTLCSTNNDP